MGTTPDVDMRAPGSDGTHRTRWVVQSAVVVAVVVYVTWFRLSGISSTFQLLGDQMRDWTVALLPLSQQPLAGPPSLAGGRSLGPIYYWLLWLSRVTIGPFVDNLPHAGGIGMSCLQSAADAVLLAALWRRCGQGALAVAAVLLIASSPVDAAVSAWIWNTVAGIALTKVTIALVLWPDDGMARRREWLTVTAAWLAVQSHLTALPVTLVVIAWLVLRHAGRGRAPEVMRSAGGAAIIILALQVPFILHNVIYGSARGGGPTRAMGTLVLLTQAGALDRLWDSTLAMGRFLTAILWEPWRADWAPLVLAVAAVMVLFRASRRGMPWLVATVLPLVAGILVYAPLPDRFTYWYLALAPSAALAVAAAIATLPGRPVWRAGAGWLLLVAILAAQPARFDYSRALGRLPEYGSLVRGSKRILKAGVRPRAITTSFPLGASDPEYLFIVLGGTLDRHSGTEARILTGGGVEYRQVR